MDKANQLLDALIFGLEDYTIDARGDVGSWIRIACIQGLKTTIELLVKHSASLPTFASYLPQEKYHRAIGGILKQGVEKLDNVRFQAGQSFGALFKLQPPVVPDSTKWRIAQLNLFDELFSGSVFSMQV